MSFIKLQLARGLRANVPATTGLPGVVVWTTDTDELLIDTGTQFQRVAPDNQVFNITNPNQLTGLSALIGDIAVLYVGSPGAYATTYMLTASPASNLANWTVIATASSTDAGTDVVVLPGATLHEFVTFIDSSGVQHLAQPTFADIAGLLAETQLPTRIDTSGSLTNIDLGTF